MKANKGKIGLFTLNGYQNYGNRLQNYATQEVLERFGFKVDTVRVNRRANTKFIDRLSKMSIKEVFNRGKIKLAHCLNEKTVTARRNALVHFSQRYIKETDYILSNDDIPKNFSDRYDFFVSGSDQVWNPYSLKGTSFYFLTFAPKHKRISYAASFGISEIPNEFKVDYRSWLSNMHRISVREDAGARIVKELTGRDAEVLVDPTLMLSKEKWLSISNRPKCKPDRKYLLTYFLGNLSKSVRDRVNQTAKENDLVVIDLCNINNRKFYVQGPSEFIDLVNSASVFFTDSFHGVVFSVLMETPFIVFDRETNIPSIFSRIDTILSKLQLHSRKAENLKTYEQLFSMDFSFVRPLLELERKRALDFLEEALNINDES